MKLRADRKAFLVATKATTVPACLHMNGLFGSGLHLHASDKAGLTLTSTNGDLTVTCDLAADVDVAGDAIVPADRVTRFLAACNGEHVAVELVDQVATITCGDNAVSLRCSPLEHWPRCAPVEGDSVVLPADDVARLRSILYAALPAAQRSTGPLLTGVNMKAKRAACTDRDRLAFAGVTVDLPDVTVPIEVVQRVVSAADGEPCTIVADDRRVTFGSASMSWTSTLLPGDFPNVDIYVGLKPPIALRVTTGELEDALKCVAAVDVDDKKNEPVVRITPDGGKVVVSNTGVDIGEASSVVACTGDMDFPIGFRRRYLADILHEHGEETATLELTDALKPCQVRSADSKLLHIVMPVRLPV